MNKFESVNTSDILVQGDEVVDPTLDIPDNNRVYGFKRKGYGRPEQLAPSQEDVGGFIFLPGDVKGELLAELARISGFEDTEHKVSNQYALQVIDAPAGMEQQLGYMRKIVIADRFALRFLFNTISDYEYDRYPEQPLSVAEVLQAFAESERGKYGTMYGASGLAGKFGGDGNFAQEALGFGFAVENNYYQVISLWSRGWLCTK